MSALTLLASLAYLLQLLKHDIIFDHSQTFKIGLKFILLFKVQPTRIEFPIPPNSELCISELSHC